MVISRFLLMLCLVVTLAAEDAATPAPADHPFLRANAIALTASDGKKADPGRLTSKPLCLIYFSAHWCPPCRAFTPELVKFYRENGGGERFEVLFVSSDKDAESMMSYMKEAEMPWAALRFGSAKTPQFKKAYGGKGIPCLVLLDDQDKVLSHSYVDGEYVGPHTVLKDLATRLKETAPAVK
jgi:nucleoredoxin